MSEQALAPVRPLVWFAGAVFLGAAVVGCGAPSKDASSRAGERRAEAEAGRAGTIDSLATGLVKNEAANWFTYESFGVRLLSAATAAQSPKESSIFSPLSAGQALAIPLLGAGGATEAAMRRALDATALSVDSLSLLNRRFNDDMRGRQDVILRVANAMWLDSSTTLTPFFIRRSANSYPDAVRSVALATNGGLAQINSWVKAATAGKIDKLFESPFDESTKLVVTNAVYLKATWLEQFKPENTVDRPFRTGSGVVIRTPMMESTRSAGYQAGNGYQTLRLPFRAGLTAIYIILPDSGAAIQPLLAAFQAHGWPLPTASDPQQEVHLRLPRLHIEQQTNLIPVLRTLGMGIAFDPHGADFRKVLTIHEGENTYISAVVQRVYLDMDEEGAVAAAATGVSMLIVESLPPRPVEFIVNRPFLFVIRDERTGTSLFVGYVADPHSIE